MKKLVLTLAIALFAICSASANNYVANDAAIDALVENSIEMVMEAAPLAAAMPANAAVLSSGNDPVLAAVLAWFLGTFGVHRYYLGTEWWMFLPYTFTFGGFGIVAIFDAVLLTMDAIEGGVNPQYLNNPRILMWADWF